MFVLYPFGANVKATKKLVAPFSLASNKFKIKLTVKVVLLTNLSLLLTNFYSSFILIPSKVSKVYKLIEDLAKMMELSCPSLLGRFSRYFNFVNFHQSFSFSKTTTCNKLYFHL